MFEDTYKTIKHSSEGLFKDRGSKFIALAYPVSNEAMVKEIQERLRKEHHGSRHHCYAYQLGFDKSAYRINDDGEPSGTAGRPIFGQIQSKDLTNVLIVVIRYFGGTKLGISGLINAYKTAAKEALDEAEIIERTIDEVYEISFEYPVMNDVMKLLKDNNTEMKSQEFELSCKIIFSIRKTKSIELYDKMSKLESLKIKHLRTE